MIFWEKSPFPGAFLHLLSLNADVYMSPFGDGDYHVY